MNIKISKLKKDELPQFITLIDIFEDVFEMKDFIMPNKSHLQKLLNRDDFMVFVAMADDALLGGLTAYTIEQYYSEMPLVYIYDLAVRTEYQYQGIGKKLVAGINSYCKENGVEEVFVQADAVDKHAVKFYKSTGGTAEEVIHFYYPLNQK